MISGFLKKVPSVSNRSDAADSDENVKNARGVASKAPPTASVGDEGTRSVETPKGPSRGVGDERNPDSPVVDMAKHSPKACHSTRAGKPPLPRVRGGGKWEGEEHLDNPSPRLPNKSNNSTPTSGQNRAPRNPKPEQGAGFRRAAQQDTKDLESQVLTRSTNPNARAGDEDESNAKPGEGANDGEAGPGDGGDLDDLFLSTSQLVREVEEMPPPPTRKRSRDDAFSPPEPPSKHPDRMTRSPRADAVDDYDLGISSQELLQLDVLDSPPERPSIRPPDTETTKPEPPAPGISSSDLDSFFLCSQELRELDALTEEAPPKPTHPTNTNPAPIPPKEHPERRTSGADEPNEPPPPATHTDTDPTNEQVMPGAQDDPEEPQRFFTSSTQELISLAENRSRATAEAEARRRRTAAKPPPQPQNARPETQGTMPPPQAGRAEKAAVGSAPRGSGERGLRRSSSLNLDDDEWWEDLEDTDLEALLGA